jgi:rRNA maturation RNase YbeY
MISIRVFHASAGRPMRKDETIGIARRVLRAERSRRASVNIIYVDDRSMVRLNSTYLRRRHATDVLSFSLSESPGTLLEGEVYVNLDQARRQARHYRVTLKNEAARLVIHGVLHLLDYEDKTVREQRIMTRLEERYLEAMNG